MDFDGGYSFHNPCEFNHFSPNTHIDWLIRACRQFCIQNGLCEKLTTWHLAESKKRNLSVFVAQPTDATSKLL